MVSLTDLYINILDTRILGSDTLLVLLRRTRTVLFCVCKVSLQSFDIMPPKSLLSVITDTSLADYSAADC